MHYTGTIWRPPYEAYSLLVQVTAGCTHHSCKFCTLYEDLPFKFKLSPFSEVKADLAEASKYYRKIPRIFFTGANPFVLSTEKLKTLAIASGIVLVTTAPIVQKNITNFTNKVISDDNKKYTQESDLNKLDSLVTRLSLNGLTREEYYELRDLMSKYKNQINEQESINYEKIIDENESKIR